MDLSVEFGTSNVLHAFTPGGTKIWIPCCDSEIRPTIGMKFSKLDEAGFKEKQNNVVTEKVDSIGEEDDNFVDDMNVEEVVVGQDKEDYDCQEANTPMVKRRLSTRVGCKAKMILKYCEDGGYIVSNFGEGHTHHMYSSENSHFQKSKRKLTMFHKKMIIDNSKVNIGPVKTYRMVKEYVGGYENIGASRNDFKKFHRDLKAYIEGSDAQIALWADPICRRNYAVFGDMLSFDTTYQSNRYNMVFGPFTGVDHHKKCVTFAAGFIAKEDVASFEWLFRTFVKAMGGREPNCLITDQDPAMKIAVNSVFQQCEHRFCMWHIMKKLPDKVGRNIIQDTEFLKELSKCVWNLEIEAPEFEEKWNNILVEFKLQDHDWLNLMFEMRAMWIPAYFRDVFMGGIMRTTSRSESENNFFTSVVNPHVSLVEFFMRYETALDAQRHYELRKEDGIDVAIVTEANRRRKFKVLFECFSHDTTCSCKQFYRIGIPCRHMIWMWKAKNLKSIPKQYILDRWTINATQKPVLDISCLDTEDDRRVVINEMWSEIFSCVSWVKGHEEDFIKNIREFKNKIEATKNVTLEDTQNVRSSEHDIEMLIGCSIPDEILVQPPKVSKNKGTGVHDGSGTSGSKRLKGAKEIAVEQSKKKTKRKCSGCGELAYHDIRNCPHKA
ncbi:protein FAR1-RELATED SEQUENCE 5-like [Chenopodium quinoa]|uniref:protein FAR1-RELATED SEQUENCE 5-like n=2 Tax=Chenopodium quinoa TaxID=63459 RepID=UPI000B79A0CB|nr:protein FAR1-RELATED SEQUENCE 5-like [Chenopodium quinoa]